MGMDRLLERLRRGSGPPLRVTEIAEVTGRSPAYIRTLIEDGRLTPAEHRVGDRIYLIPLSEARRLAREMGVIE
jgi:hypothetical protein